MKNLNIDKSAWKLVKFGDVVAEPKESVSDITSSGLEHLVGLEHIDSESIHLRRSANLQDEETTFTKVFRSGDVLFGRRRAYLKKAAQANFDGVCSGDITVFRAKKNLLPELLPFVVNNDKFFDYAVKHSAGGLSPRVKFKDLANYEFLLPPKEQQPEIAELFWAMDEVIEKDLNLEESLCSNKSIVLSDLISNGIENESCYTLGDIGKWTSGGTPSKGNPDFWSSRDFMWVTPKDMKSFEITDSMDWVSANGVTIGKAKIFPKNSVALVWRSGILQHTLPISKVMFEFTVNQDLKVLEDIKDGFLPEYVRIFLQVNSEKIRRACVKEGTTVQSMDTTSFQKFPIIKPEEQMQLQIIETELSLAKSIQNIEFKISATKALQKALINEVF